jgi:diguanylate cyclase (GGDEF)-like protein
MTKSTESRTGSKMRSFHAQIMAAVATIIASASALTFNWCSNLCMMLMPYKNLKADEYVLVALIIGLGMIGILAIGQRQLIKKLSAKDVEQRATHTLARTDFLTGIANRLQLSEYISGLDDIESADVAVLVIDLDEFKAINDNMGHAVGDEVLKCIAKRLMSLEKIYRSIVVYRLGGDEFLITLRSSDADITSVADSVRQMISAPIAIPGGTVEVSGSIGMAPSQPGTPRFEKLLADADLALFRAKRNGKNRAALSNSAHSTRESVDA